MRRELADNILQLCDKNSRGETVSCMRIYDELTHTFVPVVRIWLADEPHLSMHTLHFLIVSGLHEMRTQ
jgi:hypothetical protein